MSERDGQAQAEPSQAGWIVPLCLSYKQSLFCPLMQKKFTTKLLKYCLFSFSLSLSFPLFLLVLQFCFFLGWLTDVHQLHCLPPPQHSSRPTKKPGNNCSMKHSPIKGHAEFWLSRCLWCFKSHFFLGIFVTVIVMIWKHNTFSYRNPSISSRKIVYCHSLFHMISIYSPLIKLYLVLQTIQGEQKRSQHDCML